MIGRGGHRGGSSSSWSWWQRDLQKTSVLNLPSFSLAFLFSSYKQLLSELFLLRWCQQREAQHDETFINSSTGLSTGEKALSKPGSSRWLENVELGDPGGEQRWAEGIDRLQGSKVLSSPGVSFRAVPTEPGSFSHLQVLFALLGQADGGTYWKIFCISFHSKTATGNQHCFLDFKARKGCVLDKLESSQSDTPKLHRMKEKAGCSKWLLGKVGCFGNGFCLRQQFGNIIWIKYINV